MFLKVATITLIPFLIIQGNKVRKTTLKLPEPDGLREGYAGQGEKLAILILGDSAAAGVGVKNQKDALLGQLIKALEDDYRVYWKLHAKTGNTSADIIKVTADLPNQHFDVVLTSVGVNDITQLTSVNIWVNKQKQLYQIIEEKFKPSFILATGVPPMHLFPALPNPLAWLFGEYAKKMNVQLRNLVNQTEKMDWIEYDLEKYKGMNIEMADDGFHPSQEIYRLWAQEVADKIRQKF